MQKIKSTEDSLQASVEEHMEGQNPANLPERTQADRIRVPMTAPTRKLEVAELPGWWLQWIKGTPERIMQAKNAFFEHVSEWELDINNHDLGGDAKTTGNTDMGTLVSTGEGSGEVGHDGQAIRMYLMKQRKEYHDEDMQLTQRRNDSVVDSLAVNFHKGTVGLGADKAPVETSADVRQRYVGTQTKIPSLFQRKDK